MIYHVAKNGDDYNMGTADAPFLTIQRAANLAQAGDTVIVHEGVYREWVKPVNGGISDSLRITYQAAKGEQVVIKGSEVVTDWEPVAEAECGKVWKAVVPNSLFGDFHPFTEPVAGDWLVEPREHPVHLGEVYLNGVALYEATTLEELYHPVKRSVPVLTEWWGIQEFYPEPEKTLYLWYAVVERERTILYANFQEQDPNQACVEINVRRFCFFPMRTGLNYITVRGFEMAQAATSWAPPTAEQVGMIGPNWSKGWIIEENHFHDAKCSAVSLGKEKTTGDNNFTKWRKKPGYQNQMEAVFLAKQIGWDKERIGSHIVRNNRIHDCGQNGIVGHLGCIFSEIYGNEIYRIAHKREFYGHEIAGIKLHAAIDTQIHHNYIHHCSLGMWLDWQAQGTRVSSNIFDQNMRDFMIEVTHGPCLVDNNIFTSRHAFDNAAQGTAFVHNLCAGIHNHYSVLDRSTPYHLPHSTDLLGTTLVYGNDDRWYQNIFIGDEAEAQRCGTADYNGAPVSLSEYMEAVKARGEGDVERFAEVKQPVYIDHNLYLSGAQSYEREKEPCVAAQSFQPKLQITDTEKEVWLQIVLPDEVSDMKTGLISTELLGMTRLTEARFENPDGSALQIDKDLLGNRRGEQPMPGPVEALRPGENSIVIWKR